MKVLAFVSVLFSSALALAYPSLNDQAVFAGTHSVSGQTIAVTLTLELVQYDASKQSFLQRQTVVANGQAQSNEEWVAQNDMMTPEKIAQILMYCTQQGGALEKVQISTGETIDTCKLPISNEEQNSIYWLGNVPFGIVKVEQANKKQSSQTNLTMQSHRRGN